MFGFRLSGAGEVINEVATVKVRKRFAKLQIPSSNIQRSLKHQTSKQFVGARFWCLGFENSLELGWPARATAELVLGAFILSE
jgi:hypothetical protein